MIDPQTLRLSEVRDLLRLMAQLRRLTVLPALWRTTLAEGLANILNMYVVAIFYCEQHAAKPDEITPLPVLPEVCFAKPARAPNTTAIPKLLRTHPTWEKIKISRRDGSAIDNNAQSKWTADDAVFGNSREKPAVIELNFHDALPPPLALRGITYLLYSDLIESASNEPAVLVRFLHNELRHQLLHANLDTGQKTKLHEGLPNRQRQILDGLLSGEGEKQLAQELGLSVHTVHSYIRRLYRRFGVSSRAELFAVCYSAEDVNDSSVSESAKGSTVGKEVQ